MYFWAREGFVRPAIDLGIALERFLSSPFFGVASQCLDICQFPLISFDFCRIFAAFVSRAGPPGRACAPSPRSAPRPQHVHPPPRRVVLSFGRQNLSLKKRSLRFCAHRVFQTFARRAVVLVDCERRSFSSLCVARWFLWTACRVFLQPVRGAVVLVDCLPRYFALAQLRFPLSFLFVLSHSPAPPLFPSPRPPRVRYG